jgi:hypothetical protein
MPSATGSTSPNNLTCSRCRQAFKASARQRERAAAGAAVFCSRDCQKATNLVTLSCAHCQKDVVRRKADVPESRRVFCDGNCRNRAVKPKTGFMRTCPVDGVEFYVIPALAETRITCSDPCRRVWARRGQVTRACDYCGTEYTRSASMVGRFCKKACEGDFKTRNGRDYVNPQGYAVRAVKGWPYRTHRLAFQAVLDRPLLQHEEPHHLNGNRLDNRTDGPARLGPNGKLVSGNLELWSTSQPAGQEIGPKIAWAIELLGEYAPFLRDEHREQLQRVLAGEYVLAPREVAVEDAADEVDDEVADGDEHTLLGALAELRRVGAPIPGQADD